MDDNALMDFRFWLIVIETNEIAWLEIRQAKWLPTSVRKDYFGSPGRFQIEHFGHENMQAVRNLPAEKLLTQGKVENKCTGRSENSLPLQKESRGKSVRPSRKFREVCRD